MNRKAIGVIVLGGILQAAGSAALKYAGAMMKAAGNQSAVIIGFTLAGVMILGGFSMYRAGLNQLKLSIAQPVFSTTLFLFSTLLSVVFFHDLFRVRQLIGLVLILAGVLVVIRSSAPGHENI